MSATECAVVLTAGYGSRLFPITAVVQKSLLPVLNLPVLHYVLADLVAAGVDDIAVVVDRGDRAIRSYLEGAPQVAADLRTRGWGAKYSPIAAAHAQLSAARFTIIEQDVTTGDYGTAVPARLAAAFVGDRSCFYLSGDDLLMATDGGTNEVDLADLRSAATRRLAALQVAAVPVEVADRYGMVDLRPASSGWELESLVEKSSSRQGTYANISRYYLPPEAYATVVGQGADPQTGEVMITDALRQLGERGPVGISIADGAYFDCGSIDGWHQANVTMMETGTSR